MHKAPISKVETSPLNSPAFLKASGIAKIPVPKAPLSKCTSVSLFLQEREEYHFQQIPYYEIKHIL